MSILVLVDGWDPLPWVKALQKAIPGAKIQTLSDVDDNDEIEYALVWAPQTGVLNQFKNLKAIFSLGAGVDHLLQDKNLPDVPIARIVDPDLTARMSEWIVGQVLLHHRQTLDYQRLQKIRSWHELQQPAASEVHVGIMGLGELGRDAADILRRIGFSLRGWSRTPKSISGMECFSGSEGLSAFLSGTDILVCLLPLTPDTEGLIDREVLAALRRDGPLGGPVFVNAGRGRIQVEADVVDALRNGVLKSASLDVFAVEPLPDDSPLWNLENVLITPHVAAVSSPKALSGLIARQIENHSAGAELDHLVDLSRGY